MISNQLQNISKCTPLSRAEEMMTKQSIEPLKLHLVELENAVQEQLDM